MRRVSVAGLALLLIVLGGCASKPKTQRVLEQYTGRTISAFIEEKHYYPDSDSELPTGGRVYRFTVGAPINQCRVWIETDSSGVITRWRYENCT